MGRKSRRAARSSETGSSAKESPRSAATAPAADGLLPPSAVVARLGNWQVTVRWAEAIALLLTTALAGVLLLANLGDQCLWQDEAQTALVAETILTDGLPHACDEKNSFSQEEGRERWGDRSIYRWHTWLSFYLVAGSFSIFGISAFSARLPFALLAIASIPLVYATARSLWQSRRAAWLSAFLLATSVPSLVLARQCRYYSACMFLTVLGLWAYDRLVRRRPWAALLFVAAAVLLFQAFYVYWGIFVATVLVHAAIWHRDRLAAVALWSFASFLLVAPWLVWLFMPPAAIYGGDVSRPQTPLELAGTYFAKFFEYALPPALVVVLLTAMAIQWIGRRPFSGPDAVVRRAASLLALFVIVGIVVLAAATPFYVFRYLAPVLPLACMIGGRILESAARLHVGLGLAGLAATLLLSPLGDYLYEITHHCGSPTEEVVRFLESHANPDDVVATNFGDMPLKFHTDLRVVGGLTGEDLAPVREARWIILRRFVLSRVDAAVGQHLNATLQARLSEYEPHELKIPDVAFDNRESPEEHRYRTPTFESEKQPPVVIWQRRAE